MHISIHPSMSGCLPACLSVNLSSQQCHTCDLDISVVVVPESRQQNDKSRKSRVQLSFTRAASRKEAERIREWQIKVLHSHFALSQRGL